MAGASGGLQEDRGPGSVPGADPEVKLFLDLTPFIRQLNAKNRQQVVLKTTSLIMELVRVQENAR